MTAHSYWLVLILYLSGDLVASSLAARHWFKKFGEAELEGALWGLFVGALWPLIVPAYAVKWIASRGL